MGEWKLVAGTGRGLNGPNFVLHRNGKPTRIVVYNLGAGEARDVADWVAFTRRITASKFEVLLEPDFPHLVGQKKYEFTLDPDTINPDPDHCAVCGYGVGHLLHVVWGEARDDRGNQASAALQDAQDAAAIGDAMGVSRVRPQIRRWRASPGKLTFPSSGRPRGSSQALGLSRGHPGGSRGPSYNVGTGGHGRTRCGGHGRRPTSERG